MDSEERKHMARSFRFLEILFGAFLTISLFFSMKNIEASLFPVVKNFQISEATEVEGGIEMIGKMNKVRDCRFKEMAVYVKTDGEKIPVAADFEFLDPAKDLKSRAAIAQTWGPWRIFIPYEYDSANIKLYVRHRCHSFYETTTRLHNFDIEKTNGSLIINKH